MEKAKPVSSSSPPSSLLPSRPRLHSLPDIAHDGIGSFLTVVEVNHVMVVARWLMKTYGQQAMEVVLRKGIKMDFHLDSKLYMDIQGHIRYPVVFHKVDKQRKNGRKVMYNPAHKDCGFWPEEVHGEDCLRPVLVGRLLLRRPGVRKVVIQDDAAAMALSEAAFDLKRCGAKLQCLGFRDYCPGSVGEEWISNALKIGTFPSLTAIDIDGYQDSNTSSLVSWLDKGLRSRMQKRCCKTLKKIIITVKAPKRDNDLDAHPLASKPGSIPILSSGACEALEELILKGGRLDNRSGDAIATWLCSTGGAPHLRVLVAPCQSASALAIALSSPGMAPRLQALDIGCVDQASVQALSVAVERGAWPCLEELSLVDNGGGDILSSLVEALHVRSPKMKVLHVEGQFSMDTISSSKAAAMAVVKALGSGAFPSLQELSLPSTSMGYHWGVVKLAIALKNRPSPLRKLNLYACLVEEEGMKELAKAFHGRGGAGRYLKSLNLNNNHLGYLGAVYLADAMKSGGLKQLQELYVKQAGLGEAGIAVIVEALKCNACPRLTHHAIMTQVLPDAGPDFSATLREKMLQNLKQNGRRGGF